MGSAGRCLRHLTPGLVLAVVLLEACTYGAPRLEVRVTNHQLAPAGPLVGFGVHAIWLRPPTGISTFPDGGTPLVLAEAAAVYTCDTTGQTVRQVWRTDRPAEIRSGFTLWLGPWNADGLYFSIRGYRTTTTVPSAFGRVNYRLDPDGRLQSGIVEPERGAATSEPAGCAAAVLAAARADPPARWTP